MIENNAPIDIQINAIELLHSSLQVPSDRHHTFTSFNFNLSIESNVDPLNKQVYVIVHVDIKNEELTLLLGSLSVSCIYAMADFDKLVKRQKNGQLILPEHLIETLNTISISTTRGIMYSTFKGTFLHGAVLPIIDSTPMQVRKQKK